MAWHQKSRSNSEGRMEMGLVKWEAGKEQAAMSLYTSLLSYVMPNTLMGIRSWIGSVIDGRKGR